MMKQNASTIFLVTKPEHIFYLTHFDGEGFVVVKKHETLLATDQRYWERAKKIKTSGVKLFDLSTGWTDILRSRLQKIDTVYYEEDHLTIAGLDRWKKLLPERSWKKSGGELQQQRLIKTDAELDKLRKAAQIGDRILKTLLKELKPGVTEKAMANRFRQLSHELADGVSFDPIVAFGKNAAIPHHHSDTTRLKKSDAILIDQGVNYRGYMSDMTRCFFIGKGIPAVQSMYDQLLKVQEASRNLVRAGVKISDLAQATRAMLGKDARHFTHSLGHGVGLEIHEAPGVSIRSDVVLKSGMVITIEPGLYKPGVGGVRIEDTVIVTDDGCEIITKSPRKTALPGAR